jgi:acyl-CoA thioesterase FadM
MVHDDETEDDWSVMHVEQQKFKSSPALGGHYVIKGVRRDDNPNHHSCCWDLIMQCPDTGIIYNTATLTIGTMKWANVTTTTTANNSNSNGTFTHYYDTLHRDEFDPHDANHLPLRSVLNLCERARSNSIGGPGALRKLLEDHNILVVVISIQDCVSVQQHPSYPRQSVQVITEIIPKSRLTCDCRHVLLDDEGNVMAKATVTLMSLNATTKRPTHKEGLWSGTTLQ